MDLEKVASMVHDKLAADRKNTRLGYWVAGLAILVVILSSSNFLTGILSIISTRQITTNDAAAALTNMDGRVLATDNLVEFLEIPDGDASDLLNHQIESYRAFKCKDTTPPPDTDFAPTRQGFFYTVTGGKDTKCLHSDKVHAMDAAHW